MSGIQGWTTQSLGDVGRTSVRWCCALGVLVAPVQFAAAQAAYNVFPASQPVSRVVVPQINADSILVTLHVKDSTVAYVVTTIVHQAHLRLLYDMADARFAKRININVTRAKVMDALATALQGTGLEAKFAADGETVMIHAHQVSADRSSVQGDSIRGTVVDSATGSPIEGARVSIQDTKLATTTSDRGTFLLADVPPGEQTVSVKAFGYKPARQLVTVAEGERRTMRVVMAATTTILSGVVTTATGQQQKLAVGSDITTINVDSVMKTAPISSVTDLLENRVPGLTVVHTSGTPGDPSRLLLRGAASVNGANNPIVVVDGVRVYDPGDLGNVQEQLGAARNGVGYVSAARPSPLDQIDPNTIATVEVLKGPSASALYGSDAANGVIVITTKKGISGQTHWSVNATQGISYVPGTYPTLTFGFGHVPGEAGEIPCTAGFYNNGATSTPCIVDSVRAFQALNDPRFSPLTSGPLSRASATVSGGASALTYSFTGSASNTHGMTHLPSFATQQYTEAVGSAPPAWMRNPDDYGIWSGSGQVQATLSPQATLTVSDNLSSSTQHRTSLGLSAVAALIGVYVDTTDLLATPGYANFLNQVTQATVTSTTNATLNWRIRPWLPLTVEGGYNRNTATDKQFMPAGLPQSLVNNCNSPTICDTTGRYDLGTSQVTVATLNANTTIPLSLWRGRTVQLAAGTNFVAQSTATQDLSTTQVPVGVSDPTTFPQTTATAVYQQTQSSATYGWFLEPQLQFGSRFFITPGIRLDGGTSSGSGASVIAFPKTNLSYIAVDHTEETDGSRWTQALSLLRLRGAFGIAGVQPNPGQSLRLFSTPNVVSLDGGTVPITGTLLTKLGNTLLHPERSRELEVGFDAQFFQNRASLKVTYYNKLRIDAIEALSVAPSVVGLAQQTFQNVGNIRNRGLEFTSEVRVLDRNAVTWSVNGSVSTNSNRVISSPNSTNFLTGCKLSSITLAFNRGTCVQVGYPLDAKFNPVIVGYGDQNHDGLIESNEIFQSDSSVYLGSPDPLYEATLGTSVTLWHGRLFLAANGHYQNGMLVYNQLSPALTNSAANQPGADLFTQLLTRILPASNLINYSTVNVLKLDAVSMNLTLPSAVARAVRAQQATLELQGSNLGMWTNYAGKDPLTTSAVSGLDGYDAGGLPLPRVWQLTLRITQ